MFTSVRVWVPKYTFLSDPCPPSTWSGCRVAPSPGRRRGAQRPRPRLLHLQDCSQVEWLQPHWDPDQDQSQAPVTWRSARSDFPWGRSGSLGLVFTHRPWGGAAVAAVGRQVSRGLSHSLSQLPWLYCAGPTSTFDLWYIQTRKRGLWAAGARSLGGVEASWGGAGFLGDGTYFWGFWDRLRSRQVDTSVSASIIRDRWWRH